MLEKIKTNYKMVENEEKKGIELYFDSIPNSKERTVLKEEGYRWNPKKSCWYKKQEKNQIQEIKTGVVEIENSYSGNGWKGVNSDLKLSMKEIAKLIKKQLKLKFPDATFSVTTEGNWHYNGLNINLMKDSKNPFNSFENAIKEAEKNNSSGIIANPENWVGLQDWEIEQSEMRKAELKQRLESGNIQISQFNIDNDYELSEYGKQLFEYIKNLADSFNYDDSDSMIDYFDKGFYLKLSIGKWDKKFELLTEEA